MASFRIVLNGFDVKVMHKIHLACIDCSFRHVLFQMLQGVASIQDIVAIFV